MDVSGERDVEDEPSFRAVAEAIGLGMAFQIAVSADRSTRKFTYVGPSCQALNGVPPEAVIANPRVLYDMIPPGHAERFLAAEAEAHAAARSFAIEIPMRRPDGEVRWHRIASSPRFLPDGATLWDGLQSDITERRRIAEELEQQRRRVEVAVEATGLGLWELDLRSETLTWSDRNRRLFGLAPDAVVDTQRYMDLVHEEDRTALRDAYLAARDASADGDFAAEYRIVTPAGETRRVLSRGQVIRDEQGPRLVVGTSLDVTERHAAEERRSLLMGELAHRAKNGIAVVMSIISQTARGMASVEAFEQLLMARMQAMAASQDLVTATGGRPVEVADVMAQALAPFDLQRFQIDTDLAGVRIDGELAVGTGLLLHEMATNATKYGALSSRKGRVTLTRADAPEGRVAFVWKEASGPDVVLSNRQGFGTRLLQQALRNQDGAVKFDFEPDGFRAHVECPAAS